MGGMRALSSFGLCCTGVFTMSLACPGRAGGWRVMQESAPGAGDFEQQVLGEIEAFPTSVSIADYYSYGKPAAAAFNGDLPISAGTMNVAIVDGPEGSTLVLVYAATGARPGHAEANIHLFGDATGGEMSVQDDPDSDQGDSYFNIPSGTFFFGVWDWEASETDGCAITGIEDAEFVHMNIGEIDGDPLTPPVLGLSGGLVLSASGKGVRIDPEPYRRIRLQPVASRRTRGDLNGDGCVDETDLGLLLSAWGRDPQGDLTGDGAVDGSDLGILLAAWTPCDG